jgi:hypothetical protein
LATLEKTLAALLPIEVMAARQTQTINDSITAYSTAVGPSSDTKNARNLVAKDFIILSPFPLARKRRKFNLGQVLFTSMRLVVSLK